MVYLSNSGLLLSLVSLNMLQGIELHNNAQGVPVLRAVMLDGSMVYGCKALTDDSLIADALQEAAAMIDSDLIGGCMPPDRRVLAACIKARSKRS